MNKIFQILIKNHVFFLFILLQLISLRLLMSHNLVFESTFLKKTTEISGFFFAKEKNIKEYFFLKELNDALLKENVKLVKQNSGLNKIIQSHQLLLDDTIMHKTNIIQARVLRNSWNKKQNFMIINKGASVGIKKNMGVINNNHLVGITYTVSDNFATIINLINTNLGGISAKIKNLGHYGSLKWDGKDFQKMQLHTIPKHAKIKIGDTIVTSGYTSIFPENINIGIIENYNLQENTNFLEISVHLFSDFTKIEHVYIIDSVLTEEQKLIEKTLLN